MFLPLFRGYKLRSVCRDLQQPITITCKQIDAVNVRTTVEAEAAAYGSIKENQQLPLVVAGVNTAEPLTGPVAVLQPVKNLWTPYGATHGDVRNICEHNTACPCLCHIVVMILFYLYKGLLIDTFKVAFQVIFNVKINYTCFND